MMEKGMTMRGGDKSVEAKETIIATLKAVIVVGWCGSI